MFSMLHPLVVLAATVSGFDLKANSSYSSDQSTWYFLDGGAGTPVQCGAAGKLRCASDDGVNCKWGTYGTAYSRYAKMSGVTSSKALEVNCPGWTAKNGFTACDTLSCVYPWFYLNGANGVPVQCGAAGKIRCASDDGANCKWGTYGQSFSAWQLMPGVTSANSYEIPCPGWNAASGAVACSTLGCSSAWYYLDGANGVPVQCGSPGKIRCASDDGANCKWGTYGQSFTAWSVMPGVTSLNSYEIPCPGWSASTGAVACSQLGCITTTTTLTTTMTVSIRVTGNWTNSTARDNNTATVLSQSSVFTGSWLKPPRSMSPFSCSSYPGPSGVLCYFTDLGILTGSVSTSVAESTITWSDGSRWTSPR